MTKKIADKYKQIAFLNRVMLIPEMLAEMGGQITEQGLNELLAFLNPENKPKINYYLLKIIEKHNSKLSHIEEVEEKKEVEEVFSVAEDEEIEYDEKYMDFLGIKDPDNPWD